MTVLIFLGSLLAAMALGIPIAYSLLLSGVALMWHLNLFDPQILAQNTINGADSFPLLAVPFFMLAGEIMNVGGLSKRIVDLALTFVGHVRGGLGFVAIVAACLMAALSGSAVADTAALAALLLPMMVAAGHDRARAGGLIAAAGIIAPIIPPSIGFVIFGVAANVSISKLFLAGIVPGLMMGLAIALTWWWVAKRENVKPPPKATAAQRWAALKASTWALFLPVIVLVGLKFGVFTPTEAAVVAAVYALFVATVVYRELKPKQLYGVFVSAAKTTAVIMFLVAYGSGGVAVADVTGVTGTTARGRCRAWRSEPCRTRAAVARRPALVGALRRPLLLVRFGAGRNAPRVPAGQPAGGALCRAASRRGAARRRDRLRHRSELSEHPRAVRRGRTARCRAGVPQCRALAAGRRRPAGRVGAVAGAAAAGRCASRVLGATGTGPPCVGLRRGAAGTGRR